METHAVAQRKEEQMEKFRKALKLPENVEWGAAFDPEYQEKQKQERIKQRQEKQQEWER